MRLRLPSPRQLVLGLIVADVYLLVVGFCANFVDAQPRLAWQVPPSSAIVGVSPDGHWLATYSKPSDAEPNDAIRLWNTLDGREHVHFHTLSDLLARMCVTEPDITFSPDNRRMVVKIDGGINADFATMNMFNVDSGAELLSAPSPDFRCCFSPDGRWLTFSRPDKKGKNLELLLFDAATGAEAGLVASAAMEEDEVIKFHWFNFSPDGRLLAYCVNDGIVLWDIEKKQTRALLPKAGGYLSGQLFSPDSKLIAAPVYSSDEDLRGIKIWDVLTGLCIGKLPQPNNSKRLADHLVFTADGSVLIGACTIPSGSRHLVRRYAEVVRTVAWDVASRKLRAHLAHSSDGSDELEDPGRSFLPHCIVRRLEKGFQLLDPVNGTERFAFTAPTGFEANELRLSPDGKFLAEPRCDKRPPHWLRQWAAKLLPAVAPANVEDEHWIRLWNIQTGAELPPLHNCNGGFAIASDSKTLVALGGNQEIQLWDLPPRKPLGLILAWSCVPALLVLAFAWWFERRRNHLGIARDKA